MSIRLNRNILNFDPYNNGQLTTIYPGWLENLFADDWTVDPAVFNYKINFRASEYAAGLLAESWEFSTPSTLVVHLRHGIHWQDISPANGREFTADDVAFNFNRLFGLGGGFTKPSPYLATSPTYQLLQSVTATDKYTVNLNWKTSNPELILETIQALDPTLDVVNSDAVQKWGDLSDWHHAIGTGPFILADFVDSASATLVKNPNYWGYDERYPQNKLPYIDTLKILIIPDNSTALAALRSGKIDVMEGLLLQDAQSVQKTNPEILQTGIPATMTTTIDPRNDVKPFNDIRVREAMQMAIDLPTIASTYYAGTVNPYPSAMTSDLETGWGWPYQMWPQDLKDEYAYNPTKAKQLLADAGYPNGFNTDIVVDSTADLDLVQVVKSYFANVGIKMDIRPMDDASWTAFVQISHKQDQLAERPTGLLGNGSEPIRQLTRFTTNYSVNYIMVSDPVYDAFYPKVMAATTRDEAKQVLVSANQYVVRQHWMISLLQPNYFGLYQPWLKGYNGQFGAITGSTAGPNLVGFYPARFWIDQNLKKSTGH